jgi:hypothetical protein
MNQPSQTRCGPTGDETGRAARHQPEQRLNRSIEAGICLVAVVGCLAGIALTAWCFGIAPVLGGAA